MHPGSSCQSTKISSITYINIMPHALVLFMLILTASTHALPNDKARLVDEMAGYMEFVDYGGGVLFAEQIPRSEYSKLMLIDARDAAQFEQEHIPGAINIEWRKVLAHSNRIPKDRTVLIYCNSGSLSAQAGFALRVAGWDNVRILQGGLAEWKAKGGLDANARAGANPLRRH